MIGYQAVGDHINDVRYKILAQSPQKVGIVFLFQEYVLSVVATVVEVIVLPGVKAFSPVWHHALPHTQIASGQPRPDHSASLP